MLECNSTIELITLVAKFTNILSEIILDSENNLELESIITDDISNLIAKSNNCALMFQKLAMSLKSYWTCNFNYC